MSILESLKSRLADVHDLHAVAILAGVSKKTVERLKYGKAEGIRLKTLEGVQKALDEIRRPAGKKAKADDDRVDYATRAKVDAVLRRVRKERME